MNDRPQKRLIEGKDYHFNEKGFMILSREFLLRRGFCCHNNCTNCPYRQTSNKIPSRR
ncbi:MAG: hypothetical protein HYT11_03235 [Candidatus Levybacteria bacterium]|nr:hypothetical protein [Candidatus Levybacteria bacterium]